MSVAGVTVGCEVQGLLRAAVGLPSLVRGVQSGPRMCFFSVQLGPLNSCAILSFCFVSCIRPFVRTFLGLRAVNK